MGPIVVTFEGILIDAIAVFVNAVHPIFVHRLFGANVTELNEVQDANAPLPIVVRFVGMTILVIGQLENAKAPMDWRMGPSLNVNVDKLLQKLNA